MRAWGLVHGREGMHTAAVVCPSTLPTPLTCSDVCLTFICPMCLLKTFSPRFSLRFEGLTRDAVPHGMGVMTFGNGTGGGFHFRDVRRADK